MGATLGGLIMEKRTPTNFTADRSNDASRIVHDSKGKSNVGGLQLERIKSAFHIPPTTEAAPPLSPMFYGKTMLEVAHETGIERASICRRMAELREDHLIYPLGRTICPISKARAMFYTSNPNIALNYFVGLTQSHWEELSTDLQVNAIKAIKEYVIEQNEPYMIPDAIRILWESCIKPAIDKDRSNGR